MEQDQQRLLATIREVYGRVVYTHKAHEKEQEIQKGRANRDKWINVILMALSTTGIIASIPLNQIWTSIVASLLAFTSTLFALYRLSFSPEVEALLHRQAAKALLREREKLLLLIERCMAPDVNVDAIRREFENAVERIVNIYESSPLTSAKAYSLASVGLKQNEELTFSDSELDLLLPSNLRIQGRNLDEEGPAR